MKLTSSIFILLLAGLVASAQTNKLTSLLQQGLFEEQANRNLDAAIADYQTLATQFDQDRQMAATAVFRLGECYRAQGKTNEAAAQYQRILRDFSDQAMLATLSRQNLAGMGTPLESPASSARQQQKELLAKQIALAEQDLSDMQTRFKAGEAPQADVRNAEREVLRLRQQLAALDAGKAELADLSAPVTSEEDQEITRIQTMIQNSPDLINSTGQNGMTPLSQAARAGWLRVAGFLLDYGATMDPSALFYATSSGNKAMVEFLLDHGADVNAQDTTGGTALHSAADKGYLSVAEVLIRHQANLEARNSQQNNACTPLQRAVAHGRPAMVALLLAKGADVNAGDKSDSTPLFWAVYDEHFDVLNQLIKAGAKLDVENNQGKTALCYAAGRGSVECVKALLAAKANPNAGKYGSTLFAAIDHPDTLKLLLAAGANPNSKTDRGGTPLLSAIQAGQESSVALLLQSGANVNTTGVNDMTPLQMAVWNQNVPILSLLLSNKVDINVRHPSGRTALDMSKEAEKGFHPSNPGNYGGASSSSDREVARQISALLRRHGALDKLPDWDRITVSRPSANFSTAVFYKGTNDWNHFTLLELIYSVKQNANYFQLQFPDLANIVIMRPSTNGTEFRRIAVNLLNATNGVDSSHDQQLEFGDEVEIPEREHSLAEAKTFLTRDEEMAILNYFRNQTNEAKLIVANRPAIQISLQPFFTRIADVLSRGTALFALTSNSDLSRVKVSRPESKTGKKREWILDCSGSNAPDLWLRNGDVIEVPEKP
jgi:ankyrin repeat protein